MIAQARVLARIVGYITRLALRDTKTFVMLLRATLPLQMKSLSTEEWKKHMTPDGKPIFRDADAMFEDLRRKGVPVLLMKLEPVVSMVRQGRPPSRFRVVILARHFASHTRIEVHV